VGCGGVAGNGADASRIKANGVSVGNCLDHQTLKSNAVHGPDQSRNSPEVLGHPRST